MKDFLTVNEVLIVGHVGDTPTLRHTKDGMAVTNISVATQNNNVQCVEWHLIAFFGNIAERAVQKITKGIHILIKGHLQTYKWKDKENQERESTRINATRFVRLGNAALHQEINGNMARKEKE